jgi:hypothetical protein
LTITRQYIPEDKSELHTCHRESLKSNILVKEQFGFKQDFNNQKSNYELINDILSALKDKLIVGGIYCDLAKAFVLITISSNEIIFL